MKTVRTGFAGLVMATLCLAPAARAQTTTMPSTLRYGSGLLDIPVSSVLPHMAITATYSGFSVNLDRNVALDANGNAVGYTGAEDHFYQDASFALGLFDRAEVGSTIQALNDSGAGGNMWGIFGRVQLLRPTTQGIGLAVGGRYVTAPEYGDGLDYQPNRLGFQDRRFRNYAGRDDINSKLSLYGVASAHVRGFEGRFLPKHDLTLALGYGTGMFQDDADLSMYDYTSSNGWFFGSALHFAIAPNTVLTVMGEYNGFDVNVGTQLDLNGIRVGAQLLGTNYAKPTNGYDSPYRMPKAGFLVSLALCPGSGGLLCKPRLMDRPEPQVMQLPAPPPDTVVITRTVERPLPSGTPALVCLATGENLQVQVSAQGDTLVGPTRAPIATLRPGVVFAGEYAEGTEWYQNDEAVSFKDRNYDRSGNEVRLDCGNIVKVGDFRGVPLFATRDAEEPYQTLYVPVRPGVWVTYQAGLRRTRG